MNRKGMPHRGIDLSCTATKWKTTRPVNIRQCNAGIPLFPPLPQAEPSSKVFAGILPPHRKILHHPVIILARATGKAPGSNLRMVQTPMYSCNLRINRISRLFPSRRRSRKRMFCLHMVRRCVFGKSYVFPQMSTPSQWSISCCTTCAVKSV